MPNCCAHCESLFICREIALSLLNRWLSARGFNAKYFVISNFFFLFFFFRFYQGNMDVILQESMTRDLALLHRFVVNTLIFESVL